VFGIKLARSQKIQFIVPLLQFLELAVFRIKINLVLFLLDCFMCARVTAAAAAAACVGKRAGSQAIRGGTHGRGRWINYLSERRYCCRRRLSGAATSTKRSTPFWLDESHREEAEGTRSKVYREAGCREETVVFF